MTSFSKAAMKTNQMTKNDKLPRKIRMDMETSDVEIVVERALAKLPNQSLKPRLISDNGPQYVSNDFKAYLKERDVSHSRARPYHPQSNGKIERFHGTLKSECVRVEPLVGLEHARTVIADYVKEYNEKRLHSALKYLTPSDYLKGLEHVENRLRERREKFDKARLARRNARMRDNVPVPSGVATDGLFDRLSSA